MGDVPFDPSTHKNIQKAQLYPNKAIHCICELILEIEKKLKIDLSD